MKGGDEGEVLVALGLLVFKMTIQIRTYKPFTISKV